MKDPRPTLLERLLGRTVEIELPGRPGRRKVSKKWFDSMVANGQISPVEVNDGSQQLIANAKLLVGTARLGPINFFLPMVDRFPQLAPTRSGDWDFFLTLGAAFAGLVEHEVRNPSQEQNTMVRRVVAEELLKWQPNALDALEDCEGFVVRSMKALTKNGDWRAALSKSIGFWVCWNVLRREPEDDSDLALAAMAGNLALKIVEGCWDQKPKTA